MTVSPTASWERSLGLGRPLCGLRGLRFPAEEQLGGGRHRREDCHFLRTRSLHPC